MTRLSRLVFRSLLGAAALPIAQSSAQAIVINNTAGVQTARNFGAPFTAVTELSMGCTGSLISPFYVVTAQHCTFGRNPSGISVAFRGSDSFNTLIDEIAVSRVFQDSSDRLLDGTDFAVLELSSRAPSSITPLRFLSNTGSLVGSRVTTVGFGWNGVGSTGHQFSADGRRWGAENVIDFIGAAADMGGRTVRNSTNIFSTDFDSGSSFNNTMAAFGSSANRLTNEGTTAPGDSGGPLLVRRNGENFIAGVLSGGTTNTSVYGDISWWTGTERYRSFLESVGAQFVGGRRRFSSRSLSASASQAESSFSGFSRNSSDDSVSVPESSSPLAMLMTGLLGMGLVLTRKR
ncbi:MAG: trypsin-like serine protease [Cyanobacteria bacterium P01_F01_bin.86]